MLSVKRRDNLAIHAYRRLVPLRRAVARRARIQPGVTVCTVNYNGLRFLPHLAEAVRRFSPPNTRLIVADNASTDGSLEWAKTARLNVIAFPANLRHGLAMDLAWLAARTEYVVALDIDAFPLSSNWLDCVVQRLEDGAKLVGVKHRERGFVHPCFLAASLRDFVTHKLSFETRTDTQGKWYDTGESMSYRLAPLSFIDDTGPGPEGGRVYGDQPFGDVVFHNWLSTRFDFESVDALYGVTRSASQASYEAAVQRYLQPSTSSPSVDNT